MRTLIYVLLAAITVLVVLLGLQWGWMDWLLLLLAPLWAVALFDDLVFG